MSLVYYFFGHSVYHDDDRNLLTVGDENSFRVLSATVLYGTRKYLYHKNWIQAASCLTDRLHCIYSRSDRRVWQPPSQDDWQSANQKFKLSFQEASQRACQCSVE